jgi:hypothetical protein
MKCFVLALLLTCIGAIGTLVGDTKSPRLTTVEPDNGKVGDVATAKGENLDKDLVAELFLTDGKNDVKVDITERTNDAIKFKVPQIKAGRYRLMTASKTSMIEQPVVFEVSEP